MEREILRVLVIDDEEMVRATLTAFLERWGYETVVAENGSEGLEIFAQKHIDLVLTDLDMPVMGGLKVLEILHQKSPDTPVVIISGAGQLDDAVQTVKLGAWDYLTKPISSMAILENTINRCFEKVRLVRENKRYQQHLEQEVREKTEALRENNEALRCEIIERKLKQEELQLMYRHLEEVVDASGGLFSHRNFKGLLVGVLSRLHHLFRLEGMGDEKQQRLLEEMGSFAAMKVGKEARVVCGAGRYKKFTDQKVADVLHPDMIAKLDAVYIAKKSSSAGGAFFGYVPSVHDVDCILYLDNVLELSDTDERLVQLYITNVASALDNIVLNEEIINTQKELVITLGEVIETRSKESANHVRRVAEYSYLLAKMLGLPATETAMLRYAAPMHDAGKIGIPDSVLNKPGKLTDAEFKLMEEHTVMGHDILKGSERPILKAAAIVAYEHHEKWNGKGYPRGLAGENIHIYGRIVALADVFDALGSDRCYKSAWPLEDILDLLERERGEHFDSRIVDLMLDNLDDFLEIKRLFPDG